MATFKIVLIAIQAVLAFIALGLSVWAMIENKQARKLWKQWEELQQQLADLRSEDNCSNSNYSGEDCDNK